MNDLLTPEEIKKLQGNPLKNPNAILLVKQEDGNWRGFMNKSGKVVQVRVVDPGTALQELITHP